MICRSDFFLKLWDVDALFLSNFTTSQFEPRESIPKFDLKEQFQAIKSEIT